MDDLIRSAGFDITQLRTEYATGPRPMTYMYIGRAIKIESKSRVDWQNNARVDEEPDGEDPISRLIKNISVDWTKTGFDLAIRALKCGANDLGALTYDPFEIRLPEINGKGGMTPATVRAAITKAGHSPAERDPHHNKVAAPAAPRKEELVLA